MTSSTSLRSVMAADAELQHGVLVEERPPPAAPPPPPRASLEVRVAQRPGREDYGFLVELPNGNLVGTPPRPQPRKPTREEAFVERLEQDSGRRFLNNLANSYGISLDKVLVTVDEPLLAEEEPPEAAEEELRPRKIHRIAPQIMQTLHTAVFDMISAFQNTDLYSFPHGTSADDVLSYVINTDNHLFIQLFLQLASAEARQKAYFQPKYDQYEQNAELIKRQKMNLFQMFRQHFWDPDTKNFCYLPDTAGAPVCSSGRTIYL